MTELSGKYCQRIAETVQWRWNVGAYKMKFAPTNTGQARIQFHLNSNGSVSDLKILTNTAGDRIGQLCQQAISGEKMFESWPTQICATHYAGYFTFRALFGFRYETNSLKAMESAMAAVLLSGMDPTNLSRSIATNFETDPVWLMTGMSQMRTNFFSEAITNFTKTIEWDPEDAWAFSGRGFCRYRLKDFDGALADLTRAIELDPWNSGAWNSRGMVRLHFKDYHDALADCSKAIKFYPDFARAYETRAYAKKRLQDFDGATLDITRCLDLDPTNAAAFLVRSQIRFCLQDNTNAMIDCNRSIEINPRYALGYALRGCLQLEQSEPSAALESFNDALRMDASLDYSRFHIWVLRSKASGMETATKELEHHFQSRTKTQDTEWPYNIEACLVGSMSEQDFLAAAGGPARTPGEHADHLCEANYYAGMKHLLAGDKEGAANLFQKSTATGVQDFVEYKRARAELDALKGPASK